MYLKVHGEVRDSPSCSSTIFLSRSRAPTFSPCFYPNASSLQDDDAQGVATGASAGVIEGSSSAVQTVSARPAPAKVVQAKAAAHAIDDEDDIDDLEGLGEEDDLEEDETAPMKMKQVRAAYIIVTQLSFLFSISTTSHVSALSTRSSPRPGQQGPRWSMREERESRERVFYFYIAREGRTSRDFPSRGLAQLNRGSRSKDGRGELREKSCFMRATFHLKNDTPQPFPLPAPLLRPPEHIIIKIMRVAPSHTSPNTRKKIPAHFAHLNVHGKQLCDSLALLLRL
jgi:hypothetical protein